MIKKPMLVHKGGDFRKKVAGFSAAVKTALGNAIVAWHSDMLPDHFTRDGANKYKYEPRGSKYQKRKVRMTGQGDPLVYSGTMRRDFTKMIRLSGTAKSMKGTMSGANRALNFSGRPGMPDMRAEVIAYTSREESQLTQMVEAELTAFLQKD